jgi:hypothetical protein
MTVTFIKGREVTRPDTTPLSSSVLDHATVETNDRFGIRNNVGVWPSYNCLDTTVPTPMCPDPLLTETGDSKVFAFGEWQPAFEFAVMGGVQCSNVGLDREDMIAEVRRVFEANEGKGVEQALLYNRFVATDSDSPVQWAAPVDLTPVTNVSLAVALALLEGNAAANYAGVPTIHMPRAAATILETVGLVVWAGGKAFTKNGSKVAIGGGYDDEDMLASGQWDLFASGEVWVERSEEISVNAYVIPGDGLSEETSGDLNEFTDNSSLALAERMYRVAIDCYLAKATGTVWT